MSIYDLYDEVVEASAGYYEEEDDDEYDSSTSLTTGFDNVIRNQFGDVEEDDSANSRTTGFDDYEEIKSEVIKNDSDKSYSYPEQKQAVSEKVNRNDPCPCGSGKKYKKCHGVND